jgi:hypothetical protein
VASDEKGGGNTSKKKYKTLVGVWTAKTKILTIE